VHLEDAVVATQQQWVPLALRTVRDYGQQGRIYEGRSMNKLIKGVNLSVFKIWKIRNVHCVRNLIREIYSNYDVIIISSPVYVLPRTQISVSFATYRRNSFRYLYHLSKILWKPGICCTAAVVYLLLMVAPAAGGIVSMSSDITTSSVLQPSSVIAARDPDPVSRLQRTHTRECRLPH